MEHFTNCETLRFALPRLCKSDTVWLGADGSYFVGDTADIETEEAGDDFVFNGRVRDWIEDTTPHD